MAEIDMEILANGLADMACADIDAMVELRDELGRVRAERDALRAAIVHMQFLNSMGAHMSVHDVARDALAAPKGGRP